MREITLHQALKELKLLKKRIDEKINNCDFVSYKIGGQKIIASKYTEESYNEKVKADYQSILDLIALRNEIKTKVVMSNAITKVKVGKSEMTVAEAIERKTSIIFEKDLLIKMKEDYEFTIENIEGMNYKMRNNLDKQLTAMLGRTTENTDSTEADLFSKSYIANNESILIDPLKIETKIKDLEEKIDDFEKHVDTALSVSNAVTFIELKD